MNSAFSNGIDSITLSDLLDRTRFESCIHIGQTRTNSIQHGATMPLFREFHRSFLYILELQFRRLMSNSKLNDVPSG